MASRVILTLLVVACVALSAAARMVPGLESAKGRDLLQFGGSQGGQQQYGYNPYDYNPYAYNPYAYNPFGQPTYNPFRPQPAPYNPFAPQQNFTTTADPYVPFKPTFGGYGSSGMCPDGYMVAYGSSGIECMPIPQPEPQKSKYPPRDYLSIQRCPVGQLYRYMANGRTACLPESYVFDGAFTAAAPAPEDD